MTNRQLFMIGWLCILSLNVNAAPRTVNEAMNEAHQFLSRSSVLRSTGEVQWAYTCLENAYYVFNLPNDEGFVIISGDDRAKTVLGYTESGRFDALSLPDNFRYWLSCYEKELKALIHSGYLPENIAQDTKPNLENDFALSVPPLILTRWGQDIPYNNLCPLIPAGKPYAGQRTVTGCVATAMAQIMKYYEWPLSYSFSKTYTTETLKISFINEQCDGDCNWAIMTNTYSQIGGANTPARQAVAELMYHCGIAVKMDYDVASGAYTWDVPYAFSEMFSYDKNMQIYMRDYYPATEWEYMIMNELNAGRPVYYSGVSSSGGHAFLCDGYDADRRFHFNWGWRGNSDGYFELSALNPASMGTNGFSLEQTIVTGIQKPTAASTPQPPQLLMDSTLSSNQTSVGRSQRFTITANGLWNMGAYNFSGYFGVGLYDVNDQSVYQSANNSINLSNLSGWSNCSFPNLSLPNTVPNGIYRLYVIYSTDRVQWHKAKAPLNLPSYINVTVTSTVISFSLPTAIHTPSTINAINVYPNPADKELWIQSPQVLKNIVVFDLLGKKWIEQTVQAGNSVFVPIAHLPAGQYILQMETDNGLISRKFIKKSSAP